MLAYVPESNEAIREWAVDLGGVSPFVSLWEAFTVQVAGGPYHDPQILEGLPPTGLLLVRSMPLTVLFSIMSGILGKKGPFLGWLSLYFLS